jgi:hypothetical protein
MKIESTPLSNTSNWRELDVHIKWEAVLYKLHSVYVWWWWMIDVTTTYTHSHNKKEKKKRTIPHPHCTHLEQIFWKYMQGIKRMLKKTGWFWHRTGSFAHSNTICTVGNWTGSLLLLRDEKNTTRHTMQYWCLPKIWLEILCFNSRSIILTFHWLKNT